jgi:hypothetical protein
LSGGDGDRPYQSAAPQCLKLPGRVAEEGLEALDLLGASGIVITPEVDKCFPSLLSETGEVAEALDALGSGRRRRLLVLCNVIAVRKGRRNAKEANISRERYWEAAEACRGEQRGKETEKVVATHWPSHRRVRR